MTINPLMKELEKEKYKDILSSNKIVLPAGLFEAEGFPFPTNNTIGGNVMGTLAEFMIESSVEGVTQYLKDNDFPDLQYKNNLYEVKGVRFLREGHKEETNRGGARLMDSVGAKKIQNLGFDGIYLMVIYWDMERISLELNNCKMVIRKIEFYRLDGNKLFEELPNNLNKGQYIKLLHFLPKKQPIRVKAIKEYIDIVEPTKETINYGGN